MILGNLPKSSCKELFISSLVSSAQLEEDKDGSARSRRHNPYLPVPIPYWAVLIVDSQVARGRPQDTVT